MAKITTENALGMNNISMAPFLMGEITASTKKLFEVTNGSYVSELRGKNFTYDKDGVLKSGTITELSVYQGDEKQVLIEGFSVKVKNFHSIAGSESQNDDLKFANKMFGGNDVVNGGDGIDTLMGYGGNDKINGHGGMDILEGGAGADRFIFSKASDSPFGLADTIRDFSQRDNDRIDVSAVAGFEWLGKAGFAGEGSAQLRYAYDSQLKVTNVFGDIDGDGDADFQITLSHKVSLSGSDFAF